MVETYILVDFENVQPLDLGLLSDVHFRVKLFHGPHQNKLNIAIVRALQPLGDRVEYIQSERHGKNALDFHVAFYIGRLVESHRSDGMAARFVVVSKDRDFDSLLSHVRSLGYPATQARAIRDALDIDWEQAGPMPAPAVTECCVDTVAPAPFGQPVQSARGSASSAPETPQNEPPANSGALRPAAASPKKHPTASKPAAEIIAKVVEHLRMHPKNRPAKRATLERHIPSLLGGQACASTVQAVIAELLRRKVVAFNDKKVSYALKGKK